jgi:tRNA A37 threonylcarbamoyladenosine biosynthesis protein TsaE
MISGMAHEETVGFRNPLFKWWVAAAVSLGAIAAPSFLVFILIEMYTRAPVIHLSLYRNLAFTMASLAACLNSMSIHSIRAVPLDLR